MVLMALFFKLMTATLFILRDKLNSTVFYLVTNKDITGDRFMKAHRLNHNQEAEININKRQKST